MPPRSNSNPGRDHYGNRGATVPAETQELILQMCRDGVTRNDIHRQTGVAAASISGIVARAGLAFDRSRVRAATEARAADLRAKRVVASEKFLDQSIKLLEEMDGKFLAFNIGGKDNVYTEHQLDHVPTGDKRNLMASASVAVGRHLDLEAHDMAAGTRDVKSMLTELGRALGLASSG